MTFRAAFTLIEVLVCVTIIAVFAGVIHVSLEGRNRARAMEMDARVVQGAMQYAAREAKLMQRPHRLQILANGAGFQLMRQTSDGGETDFVQCEGLPGITKNFSSGVKFIGVADRVDLPLNAMPDFLEFEPESSGFVGVVGVGFDQNSKHLIQVAPVTRQVFFDP